MRGMQRVYSKLFTAIVALGLMGFMGAERALASAGLPVNPAVVPLSFTLETFAQNAVAGGPGKDGIPSIDQPRFVSAAEADGFLRPGDIVFGVVLHDEVKAYPQSILVWHEIVNDRFGDENVSVTYCPLTGTAIGFKRGDTTLGVSGNLVNNNLIMYDRATDSRWPQILGTAISGPLKGQALQEFRVIWTTWERWKAHHPTTEVLSTDTGYIRNYRRDPYGSYNPLGGYYSPARPPLFPTLHSDPRFQPKEMVIGARTADGIIAFHKQALREQRQMSGELNGMPYSAFYDPGLDTAYLYKNPEGMSLSYENGQFTDGQGQWPADALPLEAVNAFDAMWFAWVAFYPETRAYD